MVWFLEDCAGGDMRSSTFGGGGGGGGGCDERSVVD